MKITVGDYLLERLKELGIQDFFGVPGDYNLKFLDQIANTTGLEWRGACNELNAAYAADGYARIRGVSALLTTFGVGELSAINGIAGSYAEYVPVVHIVGMPASLVQAEKRIAHHTLGDGHYDTFLKMAKPVSVAQTILTASNAAGEIDRVLTECWLQKRPVYIGLPSDVALQEIELEDLQPLALFYPSSDNDAIKEVVERTASMIEQAKLPVLLVDIGAKRHGMKVLIEKLIAQTGLCFASMNLGKGLLNESHPKFIGIYAGNHSEASVQERVESSDCILHFGPLLSDMNTGGFSANLPTENRVAIYHNHICLQHACYDQVWLQDFMQALVTRLSNYSCSETPAPQQTEVCVPEADKAITQMRFWQQMSAFIKPREIVLAEAGSSLFGSLPMPISDGVTYVGQGLWASIGFTVGAVLGTSLAASERQSILFVGDGSFQLCAQELSTLLRYKQTPIIFLINNDGYTIERVIQKPEMPYHDIQMWHYSELPAVFGDGAWSAKVSTEGELQAVLQQARERSNQLRFIEVVMDRNDAPEGLLKLGESLARNERK